jgi:hypothetical protein
VVEDDGAEGTETITRAGDDVALALGESKAAEDDASGQGSAKGGLGTELSLPLLGMAKVRMGLGTAAEALDFAGDIPVMPEVLE